MGDCLHGRLTTGGLPISGGLWSSVWEGGRRGRRPANLQRAPASAQGARRRPTPPHLLCTSGLVREREPRQGKGQSGSGEGRGSRFVRRAKAPEPGGAPGRPSSGHFLVGIGGCQCYNPRRGRQRQGGSRRSGRRTFRRRCMEFNGIQVLSRAFEEPPREEKRTFPLSPNTA